MNPLNFLSEIATVSDEMIVDYFNKLGIPLSVVDVSLIPDDAKLSGKTVVTAICSCGKRKQIQIASILRVIQRTGQYRCMSCASTALNKDPEFRKKTSAGVKKSWTDERKKKQSLISLRMWSDPTFASRLRSLSISYWSDPLHRKESSDLVKAFWLNPEYRAKYELMWSDPEYRRQDSERIKEVWKRPEYRQRFSDIYSSDEYRKLLSVLATELWTNEEYRQKVSAAQKALWQDEDHKIKMADVRARINNSGQDSGIERVTQHILTSLGVEWVRHYNIAFYEFDLFVPSHNLLIECQGEYWHSLEKSKKVDSSKFTYIDAYFPEKKILYLYERDFLNPEIIKRKLRRELFLDELTDINVDFDFTNVSIQKLDVQEKLPNSFRSAPEEFLQSYHYAAYGRSAKSVYGAFLDGALIAVCKFAGVVREEVATSMSMTSKEVMELDRFCIHPHYQKKNFASWMIARCRTLAFEEFPQVKTLVAFSDSTYDHHGTIYKASNWIELHTVKPDYHYLSKDGYVMNKKTLYEHARSMKRKEREYAEEFGYEKIFGKEKIKFVFHRP